MKYTGEQLILGADTGRTEKEHIARYRFAQRFISDKDVLDIACGTGYGSKMLLEAGAKSVTGVDISEESIEYAKKMYTSEKIKFLKNDAELFINKEKYDIIISFETIEHVNDYQQTLNNFYNSLKKEGLLIISTPNRLVMSPELQSINDKPSNPFHVREFSQIELIDALKNSGFSINDKSLFGQCSVKKYNNPFLNKIMKIFRKGSKKYSPEVKPFEEISSLKYIIINANKQ